MLDSETKRCIDTFTYDHSERLGDAFEYLLSVLGAQGDAGQFRTPRHVIDFIVAILDPKKHETILDPACGTAGFLVSSYKHILKANTDAEGRRALTPAEKGKLAANVKGYDISPDMVRLSLVNLYLHGFVEPRVAEYDTLTSEDRWNEYADVILANPPFMSPKGGIRPHRRFSVHSKRSEVLFVDYMAEHLTPTGRAGIIVPEGIVFQSQTAHKQLRKMLVETCLVAVISLPAGVFQPYSGVKTSVLILDKARAKRTDRIAFFRVENDGFDLGAQRRAIAANDLPQVAQAVKEYLNTNMNMDGQDKQDKEKKISASCPSCSSMLQRLVAQGTALVVEKGSIAANGEYNLSGERYQERDHISAWPMAALGEIAEEIKAGFACGKGAVGTEGVPHIRPMNITETGQFTWGGLKRISDKDYQGRESYALVPGDILFNNTNSKELVGKTCHIYQQIKGGYSNHITRIRVDRRRCVSEFVAYALYSAWQQGKFLSRANKWIGQAGINTKSLSEFQIPLPPLEVQREIVAEIEGYQRVIDGARAVIDNYRPQIAVDPEWPMVEIGRIAAQQKYSIKAGPFGSALKKESYVPDGYKIYGQEQVIRGDAAYGDYYISEEKYQKLENCKIQTGDVLISLVGTYGKTLVVPHDHEPGIINPRLMKITLDHLKISPEFFVAVFAQETIASQIRARSHGGTMNILSVRILKALQIPVPLLETQQAIVAELKAEQALVDANRELIERFEKKIQATVARVWSTG